MQRATFILILVGGILAAPLLCDAGVTAHECFCDSSECCPEGTNCEADFCDDVYYKESRQNDRLVQGSPTSLAIAVDVSPSSESQRWTPVQDTRSNEPFSPGDLPLRI